jgi:hypothetical protein
MHSIKQFQFYFLGLLILCFFSSVSLHAQSASGAASSKKIQLPDFLQKDEDGKQLGEARAAHRQAKKERKLAIAREQAAKETLDLFKADGKLERVEQEPERTSPIAGLFNKDEKATSNPNNPPPSNLKEARQQYRDAKKVTKAAIARERLARERLDVLQAKRKVEKAERKAS